jgi:hypothetical protein
MAKTTAPLLSFGASGQIGKTQVYASWRGVKYARRHVVPAYRDTTPLQHTRGTFSWLGATWKFLNGTVGAVWTAYAAGKPLTDRNAWIKANLQNLRGVGVSYATDITDIIVSPGVNGGYIAPGITLTKDSSLKIKCALDAPDVPGTWSIVQQHAVAFKQQAAWDGTDYDSYYAFDATSLYQAVITVPATGTYVVASFFEFLDASNRTAFGASISDAFVLT